MLTALLFLIVAGSPLRAAALSAVTVSAGQPAVSLADHIEVFEDSSRQASLQAVQSARFTEPKLQAEAWAHLGRSNAVMWVRFRLENPSKLPVTVALVPAAPFVDHVKLYAEDGRLLGETGDFLPPEKRSHGGVIPRFDFDIAQSSTSTFYLRIDTSGNMLLPLTLQSPRGLDAALESEQRWIGGILGLMLATAGLLLLSFVASRRRAYAFYGLHILTSVGFIAAVEGHLQLVLPVQQAHWTFAFVLLADLTGLLFLRAFLDTRHTRPALDRVLVVLGGFIAICTLWVLVAGERFNGQAFVHLTVSGIAVVQAVTAVYEGLRGPRSRQLYAFSWVLYFVTRFAASLGVAGFATFGGADPLGVMMASYFFEAMLTGLALVSRIREDQSALVQSERRLADLIRESPDGIVLLTEGVCVRVNPAAEQILGHAESDLLGKPIDQLGFSSDSRTELLAAFGDALSGKLGVTRAVSLNPGEGEPRYVDANFRKFAGDGGKELVQMTMRDVSERVAAERASRIAEVRAEKAERLEAIGRLAGGVAHDFNNILTVILGNAELLKMESPSEEAQQIAQAAHTAKELTTQLLTFSKHESTSDASSDLKKVIEDSQALLKPLLSEKVELRLVLADDLPPVRGDSGQLQQVLMNVCLNARDAMPEGGRVIVEATPSPTHDDGTQPSRVRLSVTDTGSGMDELTQQRAFEPFFSTKGKGRGTGLGLATVFGIVRASGGQIRLTSAPGQGTRVDIDLPRADDHEADVRRSSAPPPPGDPGTLLLVEDEADVLQVTRKVLETAGHQVIAANSPSEALELAASKGARFDAIITDVVMPEMDGPALAKRLTDLLGPLPVLYVSGYMPDQVGHDLELGVNCLRKPVQASVLLSRVTTLLQEQPGWATKTDSARR